MSEHIKVYGVKPRIQYVADGILTTYDFPFATFKASDIEVYLKDIKQATNTYTVLNAGSSDGGSVVFNSAPTSGTVITIVRNLSIERTSDFQEGSTLRAKVLNDELDYQIACQQQIADSLNRTLVLAPYASSDDVDLSLPEPAAGKAIVWNTSGTGLENSDVSINTWGPILTGYKQSAETAANNASISAQTASTAATNAVTSAAAAETAKTDIETAKTAAETAAATAESYAQSASTSATNAATSATAASTAQIAAEAAATRAEVAIQSGGGSSSINNVTLTGDQSIDGTKTFLTQLQTSTATEGGVLCLNSAYDFQNAQTVTADVNLFRFEGQDSENHSTGGVSQTYTTSGKLTTQIGTKRYLNNDYVSAIIEASVDDTGSTMVTAPTPSSVTDSSTQIATTKWIENQRQIGNGIGQPNWSAGISLATSTLHSIDTNGWISSNGSVRLNANNGTQILGGGALGMVPVTAGLKVYISGMPATFFPCL